MARPAGSKNKINIAAREAFQLAFNKLGGAEQLTKWAKDNQTDFYKLYGRLIPVEVDGALKLTYEPLVIGKSQ
jgi:hypothetical protein